MDDRFMAADYRKLFPEEWTDIIPCRLDTVEKSLKEFWDSFHADEERRN